jgi:hypothetical protein
MVHGAEGAVADSSRVNVVNSWQVRPVSESPLSEGSTEVAVEQACPRCAAKQAKEPSSARA